MKALTIIVIILISTTAGMAQIQPCGVPSNFDRYPIELFNKLKEKHKDYKSEGIVNIPVKAHAIRKPGTSPGLTYKPQLLEGIDQANQQIDHLGIRFMLCDQINVINDKEYGSVDFDIGHSLHLEHHIDGAVNLYISQSLDTGNGQACGWATLPWWRDRDFDYIFMAEICMDDNTTLAHEVGHYLGLYHTHNVMDSMIVDSITMDTINYGIEFVDQSNCEFAGDGICDTAADPLLGGRNVNGCEYDGSEVDPLGIPYSEATILPDPRNRMSYAPTQCVDTFTVGQNDVMRVWLADRMPELTCKGDPDFELNSTVFTTEGYYAGANFSVMMDMAMYSFDNDVIIPKIGIYLSKNSIRDSQDTPLFEGPLPAYEVNSKFQYQVDFSIPDDFEKQGVHFILVYLDSDDEFPEIFEGNNFLKETIFLEGPPTAVKDLIDRESVSLYPNPVHTQYTINGLQTFDNQQVIIETYNSLGVHINSAQAYVSQGQIHSNTADLFPGHYTVNLITLDGARISSLSFVK